MGLETGTYISDLNANNPTAGDPKSEGDDHLRLLKDTLAATFPGLTGAVVSTHTELNFVRGTTSALQTQLDLKAPLASPALTGTPTAPTATAESNDTQVATTAYVDESTTAATYPAASGNSGKFLTNDGTVAVWASPLPKNFLINSDCNVWQEATSHSTAGYGSCDHFLINQGVITQYFNPWDGSRYAIRLEGSSGFDHQIYTSVELAEGKLYPFKPNTNYTVSFRVTTDTLVPVKLSLGFVDEVGSAANRVPLLAETQVGLSLDVGLKVSHTFNTGVITPAGTNKALELSVKVAEVLGNFVILGQFKMEEGTAATEFIPRPYAEDLALCQRYLQFRSTSGVDELDLRPTMRAGVTETGSTSPYKYESEL